MILSRHATKRWAERVSGLSPEREWIVARRATKGQRKKILRQCRAHAEIVRSRIFKGYYYQVAPSGVVFVCAPGEFVVTVFPIRDGE